MRPVAWSIWLAMTIALIGLCFWALWRSGNTDYLDAGMMTLIAALFGPAGWRGILKPLIRTLNNENEETTR